MRSDWPRGVFVYEFVEFGGDVTSKCLFSLHDIGTICNDLQDVVHTRALIGRVASLHESIYCM